MLWHETKLKSKQRDGEVRGGDCNHKIGCCILEFYLNNRRERKELGKVKEYLMLVMWKK